MRPTIAALVLCVLLATVAGAGVAAGSPTQSGGERAATAPPPIAGDAGAAPAAASSPTPPGATAIADGTVQAQDDEDEQTDEPTFEVTSANTIEIDVRADGDARLAVTWEYPAETEPQRDAFERLADDFRSGEYEETTTAFANVVDGVEASTGRSMSVGNVDREASVTEGTGELTLWFTWTNFGAVSEEQVVVEDAFRTDEGLWIRSLDPEQTLIVRGPEGYGVSYGEFVRDNAVVWEGPTTFEDGDLRVVFDGSGSVVEDWLAAGAVGALLLVVGAGGLLLYRQRRTGSAEQTSAATGEPTATGDGGSTVDDGAAGGATAGAGAAGASGDDADDGATGDDGVEDEPADDGAVEDDGVDPELLSDEERVERLLERNGGRMKQARIVDETGWSNAKVSQLLSQMAEDDRVDKLRLGRENLITLPDEDVTATE